MRIHHGLPEVGLGPAVLTIGSFDGVHLGHQQVVSQVIEAAGACSSAPVLVTFEPHPRCVLDPDNCPKSITTLEEKLALLEQLGVAHSIVIEFTPKLAQLRAADFMAAIRRSMELRRLVVGFDFALGRRREGDVDWLRANGGEQGFAVDVVLPVKAGGQELHSSNIRQRVALGDVEGAARLLGRHFTVAGTVHHGDRVGRGLGFPTVNLAVEPNKLVPGRGAYAGWVRTPTGRHQGAVSIGYRPTFGWTRLTVEAYLLDFSGDLYGERVEISFVARLHDDIKFPTPELLAEQIARDVAETRRILQHV
jgi:riboflavin kinase/FMN adenylyltransferase